MVLRSQGKNCSRKPIVIHHSFSGWHSPSAFWWLLYCHYRKVEKAARKKGGKIKPIAAPWAVVALEASAFHWVGEGHADI